MPRVTLESRNMAGVSERALANARQTQIRMEIEERARLHWAHIRALDTSIPLIPLVDSGMVDSGMVDPGIQLINDSFLASSEERKKTKSKKNSVKPEIAGTFKRLLSEGIDLLPYIRLVNGEIVRCRIEDLPKQVHAVKVVNPKDSEKGKTYIIPWGAKGKIQRKDCVGWSRMMYTYQYSPGMKLEDSIVKFLTNSFTAHGGDGFTMILRNANPSFTVCGIPEMYDTCANVGMIFPESNILEVDWN